MNLTEQEIKQLFNKFQSIKRYTEKILFYDNHFNLIPFRFPDFKIDLYQLFSDESVNNLFNIFETERKNPLSLLERTFSFENSTYTFSVKPSTSNNPAISNYALSKFLTKKESFESLIYRELQSKEYSQSLKELLKYTIEMIGFIENKLQYGSEVNFTIRFMTVFSKGLTDFLKGIKNPTFNKKT